jgi:hypothetical protein
MCADDGVAMYNLMLPTSGCRLLYDRIAGCKAARISLTRSALSLASD